MELKGIKINFLGDSITEGVGCSDVTKTYWKLLEQRDGVIARGYGISGTRIAKQIVPTVQEPTFDLYFGSRVDSMDPDADVITVFGGTNDYGHGDAPIGRFEDRTEDTFCGALHCLYRKIIERYPAARIVIMTPTHRLEENKYTNEYGLRNAGCLADYVRIIRETAGYYGLPVLDLYKESGLQPDVPVIQERYMPDGLHPSDAGQELIYRKLRDFLLSL